MFYPSWVLRYRWPETYRFKHVPPGHGFMLYGRPYVRISARKYRPAIVRFCGYEPDAKAPAKAIDSINVPVRHII
jgi:hypothetical protein